MTVNAHNESFTIKRTLSKPPARAFSAWSDVEKKRKWYARTPEQAAAHVFDFRVGGREYGCFEDAMGKHENETRYFEIIPDRLIVFGYSMSLNGRVHSVSLVTLRFEDAGGGTALTYSEQMCVIEPSDGVTGREHGWNVLLDAMEGVLEADRAG